MYDERATSHRVLLATKRTFTVQTSYFDMVEWRLLLIARIIRIFVLSCNATIDRYDALDVRI
jgi:hypothetical protein